MNKNTFLFLKVAHIHLHTVRINLILSTSVVYILLIYIQAYLQIPNIWNHSPLNKTVYLKLRIHACTTKP